MPRLPRQPTPAPALGPRPRPRPRPGSRPGPTPAAAPANGAGTAGGEVREVEWQLTAPDLGVVRRWLEEHTRLDHLTIEPLPAQQLHDTYLDTADWRILRAGFALRLRDTGVSVEATLKGLRPAREGLADRREITEPLVQSRVQRRAKNKASALARATGAVGRRVHDVAGVKPLRTLFEVRTSRQRFAVRRRSPAADIGEIALDEARFSRGNGHRRPMLLTRVELEAVGPDSAPLERLANRLRAECGLRPATENKFAVGLRSASLAPPRGAGPDREPPPAPTVMSTSTRAGDFAAEVLRRLVAEWQVHEPLARLGEGPEPLHRLRVTARRIQTVLGLFSPFLPAGLRKSQPTVKGLLDALGAVRDIDVRLAAASSFRGSLPEDDRAGLDPLMQHLQSERARARSIMLRTLDAKRTRDWLDALPEQLARTTLPTASISSRSPAGLTVIADLIHERYRKLRRCARRLTPESSMTEFHALRVRVKKLGYALEIVTPTYGKPAQEMLATLQKLQGRLGRQHDADVIARYLAKLASRPPPGFNAATLFMMGRMAQTHARRAARMGGKVARSWRKLRGRRWKALRSRMTELRDGAPADSDNVGAVDRGARGNGRLARDAGRWALPNAIGH